VRFRFTKGGSPEDRKSFLDTVKTITSDLNFYAAYTPEEFYASVNIHHYDYTRTSRNGAGLLVVDIWAEEVRVTAESSTTGSSPVVAPKSPASATPQNNGLVNSQDNSSNTILMNQAQKNALSEELFSGQPGS
jgi:hypothetical protein